VKVPVTASLAASQLALASDDEAASFALLENLLGVEVDAQFQHATTVMRRPVRLARNFPKTGLKTPALAIRRTAPHVSPTNLKTVSGNGLRIGATSGVEVAGEEVAGEEVCSIKTKESDLSRYRNRMTPQGRRGVEGSSCHHRRPRRRSLAA